MSSVSQYREGFCGACIAGGVALLGIGGTAGSTAIDKKKHKKTKKIIFISSVVIIIISLLVAIYYLTYCKECSD